MDEAPREAGGPGTGRRRRLPVAMRVALEGAGVGISTAVLVLLAPVVADAVAGRLPGGQMRDAITGAPPVLVVLAVTYGLPTAVLVVAVGTVICAPVVALCPAAPARPTVLAAAVGTSVALALAVVVLETPSDGPSALLVGLVGGVLAAWRTRAVLASWVPRVAYLAAGGEKVRCAAGTRGVVHIDQVALLRGLVGRPFADPLLDGRALVVARPGAVPLAAPGGRRPFGDRPRQGAVRGIGEPADGGVCRTDGRRSSTASCQSPPAGALRGRSSVRTPRVPGCWTTTRGEKSSAPSPGTEASGSGRLHGPGAARTRPQGCVRHHS